MNKDCVGCWEEYLEAIEMQKQGFFVATCVDRESSSPEGNGDFGVMIVDEDGRLVEW